jgi:hypothetical protein
MSRVALQLLHESGCVPDTPTPARTRNGEAGGFVETTGYGRGWITQLHFSLFTASFCLPALLGLFSFADICCWTEQRASLSSSS